MGSEIFKALATLGLFAAILGTIIVALRTSKKSQSQRDKERDEQIKVGVRRGICDDSGNPLCKICKVTSNEEKIATEYTPVTGRPWWDELPIVSRIRELYALPDRYMVIDDYAQELRLCSQHKKMAVTRLKAFHAELRAEHSRFNAEQRERVDYMDQGQHGTLCLC